MASLTRICHVEQLYIDAGLVLDASTRLAAAAGSGAMPIFGGNSRGHYSIVCSRTFFGLDPEMVLNQYPFCAWCIHASYAICSTQLHAYHQKSSGHQPTELQFQVMYMYPVTSPQ